MLHVTLLDKPKTVSTLVWVIWFWDEAWINSDVAVVESKAWNLGQLLAAWWRRGYNRWLTARRLWVWGLGLWRATVAFFCYSGLQKALIWIRSTRTDSFIAHKCSRVRGAKRCLQVWSVTNTSGQNKQIKVKWCFSKKLPKKRELLFFCSYFRVKW